MNKQSLTAVRGNTIKLKFHRETEDGKIIKEKVDQMFMTFKKSVYTKNMLFQKSLRDETITFDSVTGYYHIVIEPKDTENLSYDNYYFDIEIESNNVIKTLVVGVLTLTEKVTFACNRGEK